MKWTEYTFDPVNSQDEFGSNNGVSLRLGKEYGQLVDIDMDSAEVRALASQFLGDTDCVFGRASAPGSHYLYRAQEEIETVVYKTILHGKTTILLELRGGNRLVTVPPSVHPSGEQIQFKDGRAGMPSLVDGKPCASEQISWR